MRISDWSSDVCSSDLENRARARRPRARRLQLRDVPRRKRREDLQVERQRPQPRSMADLRPRREPRFLHLSRAEEGQGAAHGRDPRSEEHTSELQSLMRISYAVFCLKTKKAQPKLQINNHI